MAHLLTAASACKNSRIIITGYRFVLSLPSSHPLSPLSVPIHFLTLSTSQGAALTHRAVQSLSAQVKSKIAGIVTFGDTQTLQDGGRIRGFPTNRTLIICNIGDVICTGTLLVYPVHLDYVKWVPTAVAFLIEKLLEADAQDPFMGLMNNTEPPALPAPSAWPPAWTSSVAPMPLPSNG